MFLSGRQEKKKKEQGGRGESIDIYMVNGREGGRVREREREQEDQALIAVFMVTVNSRSLALARSVWPGGAIVYGLVSVL
jgi:hypothetical protein